MVHSPSYTLLNASLIATLLVSTLIAAASGSSHASHSHRQRRALSHRVQYPRAPANVTHENSRRAISVHNVQEYTGSGHGTYYYDILGNGGKCGTAQPDATLAYAENKGMPRCLGKVPTALQKTLEEYQSNKVVAMANFNFEYCGKEVLVKDSTGNWKGGFIMWDGCQACEGGLDFSSTEFSDTFGQNRCSEGRVQIDFKITNTQLWDPLVDKGGNVLPDVLEAKSREVFPNEYCTLSDKNKPETGGFRCSGNFFQQCIEDNQGTNKTYGLLHWFSNPPTGCLAGTTCQYESTGKPGCM